MTETKTIDGVADRKSVRNGPIRLSWFQPKMGRRRYQLRHGDAALAEYRGRGLLALHADVIWREERWSVQVEGFFKHTIAARNGNGEEVARFEQQSYLGPEGWLAVGGRSYWLRSDNFWQTKFNVEDTEGKRRLRLVPLSFLRQDRMIIEADDASLPIRDLVAMAAIGMTLKRVRDQSGGLITVFLPFR